jgi:hypothetical protein
MPATQQVAVVGLKELQRAFRVADKTLSKELTAGLRRAGEPVRVDAENLATIGISNIGVRWSRMRVGVRPGVVYVAPRARGARGVSLKRRPNLARLLRDKAMTPALEKNLPQVEKTVDEVINKVEAAWERG